MIDKFVVGEKYTAHDGWVAMECIAVDPSGRFGMMDRSPHTPVVWDAAWHKIAKQREPIRVDAWVAVDPCGVVYPILYKNVGEARTGRGSEWIAIRVRGVEGEE